jgi:hypothetical protein
MLQEKEIFYAWGIWGHDVIQCKIIFIIETVIKNNNKQLKHSTIPVDHSSFKAENMRIICYFLLTFGARSIRRPQDRSLMYSNLLPAICRLMLTCLFWTGILIYILHSYALVFQLFIWVSLYNFDVRIYSSALTKLKSLHQRCLRYLIVHVYLKRHFLWLLLWIRIRAAMVSDGVERYWQLQQWRERQTSSAVPSAQLWRNSAC